MRRHLFTHEFFAAFPRSACVELATEDSLEGRSRQMGRRMAFIEERLPTAEFCSMFTRKGPNREGGSVRVQFHFADKGHAAFFLLGASDL